MKNKLGPLSNRRLRSRTNSLAFEALEPRAMLAIDGPSFELIADTDLDFNAPIHIGIDGDHGLGQNITYSVTSDNAQVEASIVSGNRSWEIDVVDHGTMTFEFFEQRAPNTTAQIIQLAEDGFYDDGPFHRIIENFVIQATGKQSPLEDMNDEFHLDLLHSQDGTLSMAKAGEDDNNAEFFVTQGTTPHLDFHHSVFGVMTEGWEVRDSIVDSQNVSVPPDVIIDTTRVVQDNENGTLFLKALSDVDDPVEITVTATDEDGGTFSQTFIVNVGTDSTNKLPFIGPITEFELNENEAFSFDLSAFDLNGDNITFGILRDPLNQGESNREQIQVALGSEEFGEFDQVIFTEVVSTDLMATQEITFTPAEGFTGTVEIWVFAADPNINPLGSQISQFYSQADSQVLHVTVVPAAPATPQLQAASDSGGSDSDQVTNMTTADFLIEEVHGLSVIKLFAGDTQVGLASVPLNATSIVVTADLSGLVDGDYTITAVQALNVDSPASAGLAITLDTTIDSITSALPTSVVAGVPNAFNAEHTEEGDDGFTYSLFEPAAGMSIDPATGEVTWTPTAEQIGEETINVRATDLAGNQTTQTGTVNVSIGAPTSVDLQAGSDTGSSDSDNVTKLTELSFLVSGVLPGAAVTLFAGTTEIGSAVVAGGESTVVITTDTPSAFTDEIHSITAKQTFGITSAASASLSVTIDTADPAALTAAIPTTAIAGSSFDFDADHAEEGDTGFVYSLIDPPTGATIDPATGEVTWAPSVDQIGSQDLKVRTTDKAGNETTTTATVVVAPTPPTEIDLLSSSDSGVSDSDDITNLTTLDFLVSGVLEGATVTLFAGGVEIGSAVVETGETTVVVTTSNSEALTDGFHSIVATQTVNPTSGISDSMLIEIDTTDPGDITPALPVNVVSGGSYVYDAENAEEGDAGFSYSLVAPPVGMTIDAATGEITWTPNDTQLGNQTVKVRGTDQAGNSNDLTATVVVAPKAPTLADLVADSDTGLGDSDDLTKLTTLDFLISDVVEGATVKLFVDGSEVGSAVVGSGDTSVVITTNDPAKFTHGFHSITSTQTLGATSATSAPLGIQVDTSAPGAITPALPTSAVRGELYTYNAGNAEEGDTGFRYSLTSPPDGMTIDPLTGEVSWTPSVFQVGDHTVEVVATDSAGNEQSISATVTVELPAGAPTDLELQSGSDSGESDSDNVTKETTLSFLVSGVEEEATVNLYAGSTLIGQAVVQAGQTTVVVTTDNPTALTDTTHTITATQTTTEESAASSPLSVTVDTTDPAAITPAIPTTAIAGSHLAYEGQHTEEGQTGFVYSLIDPPTGASIDAVTGELTWTPSVDQIGNQELKIRTTDLAGNETTNTATVEVAPPAPGAIDLLPGYDSGSSDSDNTTNETTLGFLVSGVLEGATVTLFAGNTEIGSAVVAGGESTVEIIVVDAAAIVEGANSITATQTVNPTSAASAELVVTLDLTDPVAITPAIPTEAFAGTEYTYNPAHEEEGVNGFVYSLVGEPDGMTIDAETGEVSWTPNDTQFGFHTIEIRGTDLAGNETILSETVEVINPAPDTVSLHFLSDSGSDNSDGVTNVTAPLILVTGVLEGATVRIFANSVEIGSEVVGAGQTTVSVQVTSPEELAEGLNTITATQTVGSSGNQSAESDGYTFELDLTGPAAITPAIPTSVVFGSDFTYDADNSEEGLTFSLVNEPTGMTIDAETGEVSWTPDATQIGEHTIEVRAYDLAGNETILSGTVEVTLAAPTSVDLLAESDSGASDTDNITNQTTLSFLVSGVVPGSTVRLYAGDTEIGSAVVADGESTVVVTTDNAEALTDGTHEITATQTVNPTSDASSEIEIEIDTTIAAITPEVPTKVVIGDTLVYDAQNAEEGSGFSYSLIDSPEGMTIDAATGEVSWTPDATQYGAHDVTVRGTDLAGNEQDITETVEVAPTAPTSIDLIASSDTGLSDSDDVTNQATPSFLVSEVTPGAVVRLYSGSKVIGSAIVPDGDTSVVVNVRSLVGISHLLNHLFSGTAGGPASIDPLAEGMHSITADQTIESTITGEPSVVASEKSTALNVKVDVTSPEAISPTMPASVIVGDNYTYDAQNGEEGDAGFRYSLANSPAGMTIDPLTGELAWTPTSGDIGDQGVDVVATDLAGNERLLSSTIVVNPIVTAVDDKFNLPQFTADNDLDVLNNDIHAKDANTPLNILGVGRPSDDGKAVVAADGKSIEYTPAAGFFGTETITYTLSDGLGGSVQGNITVVVERVLPAGSESGQATGQLIRVIEANTPTNPTESQTNLGTVNSISLVTSTSSQTRSSFLDGSGGSLPLGPTVAQTVYKIPELITKLGNGSNPTITPAEARAAMAYLRESLGSDSPVELSRFLNETSDPATKFTPELIEQILKSGNGSSSVPHLPSSLLKALQQALENVIQGVKNNGPQDGATSQSRWDRADGNDNLAAAPDVTRLQSLSQHRSRPSFWAQLATAVAVTGTAKAGHSRRRRSSERYRSR